MHRPKVTSWNQPDTEHANLSLSIVTCFWNFHIYLVIQNATYIFIEAADQLPMGNQQDTLSRSLSIVASGIILCCWQPNVINSKTRINIENTIIVCASICTHCQYLHIYWCLVVSIFFLTNKYIHLLYLWHTIIIIYKPSLTTLNVPLQKDKKLHTCIVIQSICISLPTLYHPFF